MLFRNGTRLIDGLVFLAASDPVQMFARLEDGFEDCDRYRGDGGTAPENEPSATGLVLFENGVRGIYLGEKNTAPGMSFEILGAKGAITYDGHADQACVSARDTAVGTVTSGQLSVGQHSVSGIRSAYEEMFGLIENGGEGSSPGHEARKALQIMLGFLISPPGRQARQRARLIADQTRTCSGQQLTLFNHCAEREPWLTPYTELGLLARAAFQ